MPEDISEHSAKLMFPKDNGQMLSQRPSEEIVQAAFKYSEARESITDWEKVKKESANTLKAKLKSDSGFKWDGDGDGGTVSWKSNKQRSKVDVKKMAQHLAEQLGLDFKELEKQYTIEVNGARVLRVNVRKTGEETA